MITKVGFLERRMTENDWTAAHTDLTIINDQIGRASLESLKNGLEIHCDNVMLDDVVLYTDFIAATLSAAGWNASITDRSKFTGGRTHLIVCVKF
jgi:hypothetical protein